MNKSKVNCQSTVVHRWTTRCWPNCEASPQWKDSIHQDEIQLRGGRSLPCVTFMEFENDGIVSLFRRSSTHVVDGSEFRNKNNSW